LPRNITPRNSRTPGAEYAGGGDRPEEGAERVHPARRRRASILRDAKTVDFDLS
jgi:hypothetical protein